MTDPERPLCEDAKREIAALAADLTLMADLRWKLAGLELRAARDSLKRLAVVLVIAVVAALTALPLLVVHAAEQIEQRTGFSAAECLLVCGLALLVLAATGVWLAWRRFRREFVGLEATLKEFREDLLWLREWRE